MPDEPQAPPQVAELLNVLLDEEQSRVSEELSKAVQQTIQGELGKHLQEWAQSGRFQEMVRPIAEEEAKMRARRIADQLSDDLSRMRSEMVSAHDIEAKIQQAFETEMSGIQRRIQEDVRLPLDRIEREYTPLAEFRSQLDRFRDVLTRMVEKEIHGVLTSPDLRHLIDERGLEQVLRECDHVTGKLTDQMEKRITEALSARPNYKEIQAIFERHASELRQQMGDYVAGHTVATLRKVMKEEQIVGREFLLGEIQTMLQSAVVERSHSAIFHDAVEQLLDGPIPERREKHLKEEILRVFQEEMTAQKTAMLNLVHETLSSEIQTAEKARADLAMRLGVAEERLARLQETTAKSSEVVQLTERLLELKARGETAEGELKRLRAATEQTEQETTERLTQLDTGLGRLHERLEREAQVQVAAIQQRLADLGKNFQDLQSRSVQRDEFERLAREQAEKSSRMETRLTSLLEGLNAHFAKLEADLVQCIRSGEIEARLQKLHDDIQEAVHQWEDNLATHYLRREAVEDRFAALASILESSRPAFEKLEQDLKGYAKHAEVDEVFRVALSEWKSELTTRVEQILHASKLDLLPDDILHLKTELERRAQNALDDMHRKFDSEVAFVRERIKTIETKVDIEMTLPEAQRLVEGVKREIHAEFMEEILKRAKQVEKEFHEEIRSRVAAIGQEQERILKRIPEVTEKVLSEHPIRAQMDSMRKMLEEGLEKKIGEEALHLALAGSLQRLQQDLAGQIQRSLKESEIAQRGDLLQQAKRLIQEAELDRRENLEQMVQKQIERSGKEASLSVQRMQADVENLLQRAIRESELSKRNELAEEIRRLQGEFDAQIQRSVRENERLRTQLSEAMQSRPTLREIEERLYRSSAETRELVLKLQEQVQELATALGEAQSRRTLRAGWRRPLRSLPNLPPSQSQGSEPPRPGRPSSKERRPGW